MTTINFCGLTFDDEAESGFAVSKMVGWYDAAPSRYSADDRPQGNGTFGPGRIFRAARVVSVEGSWSGESLLEAYQARDQLMAIQSDGYESPFAVGDLLGSRWINGGVSTAPTADDGLYQPFFKYAFDVIASDPFKYGPEVPVPTGLPMASSGLVWPLGTKQSGAIGADGTYPSTYFSADPDNPGLYLTDNLEMAGDGTYLPPTYTGNGQFFDWGTAGSPGRALVVNDGTADTYTVMDVTGGFSGGVELVWVPTGDTIRLERPIDPASVVTFDPRNGRVTIDGGSDITDGRLTKSQWWSVPPKSSGEIQFNGIGTVTGTPMLTARTAPAYV